MISLKEMFSSGQYRRNEYLKTLADLYKESGVYPAVDHLDSCEVILGEIHWVGTASTSWTGLFLGRVDVALKQIRGTEVKHNPQAMKVINLPHPLESGLICLSRITIAPLP